MILIIFYVFIDATKGNKITYMLISCQLKSMYLIQINKQPVNRFNTNNQLNFIPADE